MCSYTNFLLLGTQFLDHVVMNSSAGENISNLVTEGYHSKSSLSEDGERNGLRCSNNQNLCSYSDSDINGIDIVDCGEHGVPKCDQQSGSKAKKTGLSRIMHRVSKKFSRFSSKTSYNVSLKNSVLSSNVNSRQTDLAVLDFENADPPVLWRSRSMAISTSFHEVLDGREVDGENTENMRKNCERLFRSKSVDPRQDKIGDSSAKEKHKRRSKPKISTARKIAFNPCFSPTVSDDELSVHEEEVLPTSSGFDVSFMNPFRRTATPTRELSTRTINETSSHSVIPRPIANVAGSAFRAARDLRARLSLVAHSENQQNGQASLNRLSTATPNGIPITGLTRADRKNVHTIVEYTNVLMPDLITIMNSIYYWGTMDRYEAEKLLDGKPDGTFLLRDSAQINYVFSVSFRRYQRTLHARIEQSNGKFSFDIHDSTVFSAPKITALIENYKNPSRCLFFEPQLSVPLCRNFVFSLKELSRAVVAGSCTYDSAMNLPVPNFVKKQVREYHYKQAIRVTDKEESFVTHV